MEFRAPAGLPTPTPPDPAGEPFVAVFNSGIMSEIERAIARLDGIPVAIEGSLILAVVVPRSRVSEARARLAMEPALR